MARRAAHRLYRSAVALVLTVAVFGSAAQAGRIYWYCTAMHAAMSHACCGDRGHRAADADVDAKHASRQASHHAENQPELVAPACCESRSLASLAAFVTSPRPDAPNEPLGQALLTPPLAAELALYRSEPSRDRAPGSVAQLAPDKLRVHARLMVFHI